MLLEQHLMPDYAHPAQAPLRKHTHTHTNKKELQPTQPFFKFPSRRMHKFSYHTTAQK